MYRNHGIREVQTCISIIFIDAAEGAYCHADIVSDEVLEKIQSTFPGTSPYSYQGPWNIASATEKVALHFDQRRKIYMYSIAKACHLLLDYHAFRPCFHV